MTIVATPGSYLASAPAGHRIEQAGLAESTTRPEVADRSGSTDADSSARRLQLRGVPTVYESLVRLQHE
jgi:hypothetical protein